jgi:hypothetical protein
MAQALPLVRLHQQAAAVAQKHSQLAELAVLAEAEAHC